jgi:toxin ParE1/3/4
MTKYTVDISPMADRDIEDIGSYLFDKNPIAARQLIDQLQRRFAALEEFPMRGVSRDDLSVGLRFIVEGEYLVFYTIEKEIVMILRVLHGKRDLESEF